MPETRMYSEQETIDALLDLLPIVADREWEVEGDEGIRCDHSRCPLCELTNEVMGEHRWNLMAHVAVRSHVEPDARCSAIDRLMAAADYKTQEPTLRYRMMLALGLTPDVEAPADAPA